MFACLPACLSTGSHLHLCKLAICFATFISRSSRHMNRAAPKGKYINFSRSFNLFTIRLTCAQCIYWGHCRVLPSVATGHEPFVTQNVLFSISLPASSISERIYVSHPAHTQKSLTAWKRHVALAREHTDPIFHLQPCGCASCSLASIYIYGHVTSD